jgi:DNA-binding NarL/FixJ family response regulator
VAASFESIAEEVEMTFCWIHAPVRTYVRRIGFKLHVRSKVEAIIKYLS